MSILKKSIKHAGIIFCLIAAILSAFLSGCAKAKPVVQEGIVFENEKPHDAEVGEYARGVIYEILLGIEEAKSSRPINEAQKEKLKADAYNLWEKSIAKPTPQYEYTEYIKLLDENAQEIISGISAALDGGGAALSSLRQIYFEISARVGADYVSEQLFYAWRYSFESNYEKHMSRYENGEGGYHKALANEYAAKIDVLDNEIGSDSFGALLRAVCFIQGIFCDGEIDKNMLESFSDGEIAEIAKHIDFSDIKIGSGGYKLFADFYSDTLILKEETTIFDEILYAANYNGDIDGLAAAADDAILLFSSILARLEADDIGLLREGDYEGFVERIFSRFSEEDKLLFKNATTYNLVKSDYERIASDFFGEGFAQYKNSLEAASLDELFASVGTPDFYNTLEGYIFGISPAFSYGMRK